MMNNYCHTDIQKLPSCIHGLVDYCKICDGIKDNKPSKFVVDAVNEHFKKMIDELPTYKAGDIIAYTTNGIIKMREFDLQKALAGEKLITRDGRKITEIYQFKTYNKSEFNIMGVIENEEMFHYDESGRAGRFGEFPQDLFMAPTTKTYYVNVYENDIETGSINGRRIHCSKEEAQTYELNDRTHIARIEFTVEE